MNALTDDEKALALKDQGNQLFRANDLKGAYHLWTKAIDEYKGKAQPSTIQVLKSNRSAVLLKLQEWEMTMTDCVAIIRNGSLDDKLTFKALRRFNQASLNLETQGLEDIVQTMNAQKSMAKEYQENHPGDATSWFSPEEEQILQRFQATLDSKVEYERLNPPSDDNIMYRYEVALRSRNRQSHGADTRIEETYYHFWYSGPKFEYTRDRVKLEQRSEMVNRTMLKAHKRDIIEQQNARFGDGWGCVVCGGQATAFSHGVLDALDHQDTRIEDYMISVCRRGGDCWKNVVRGRGDLRKDSLRLKEGVGRCVIMILPEDRN